jgi:hypothetical protein
VRAVNNVKRTKNEFAAHKPGSPAFENDGHECLVVRAFEPILDPTPLDQFSAAADRLFVRGTSPS